MKKKLPKCVTSSFDHEDEFELDLLKYVVSKKNMSRYIKRLIYDDMRGVMNQVTTTVIEPEPELEYANEMAAFY